MTPEEPTYNVSQKMKIRVSIANYGKSPAMKVSVFGNIIIGPNALEKTDAWFAKLGDKPPAETSPNETFLRPGTMPDGTGPMFNIVESERELTKEDALFIFSTKDRRDIGYVVVMRLFYTDISGNPYYADICSYSTTTRQLGACKKHNEVTAPYGLTARNEMKGKTFASWASAISGFVAAALWFGATLVTVKYKQRFTQSGPEPAIIERDDKTGEEKDFLYTAKRQTLWNRWAALFTAISMLCAAVSLLM